MSVDDQYDAIGPIAEVGIWATRRRELHRGADVVSVTPQVFDLLDYLIRNRERVVSKDDLIDAVWNGRNPNSSQAWNLGAWVRVSG